MIRYRAYYHITAVVLLFFSLNIAAQHSKSPDAPPHRKWSHSAVVSHDVKSRPDTLRFIDRLSLSTNLADWTLLLPNVGLQYELRGTQWGRWAIDLRCRYNPATSHTYRPAQVYDLTAARAELRYYWRTRRITQLVPRHRRSDIAGRLLSARRDTIRHPQTTYYRGGYAEAADYNLMLGHRGHRGKAIGIGMTYGIVQPLFEFNSGSQLDLDLGVAVGLHLIRDTAYRLDRLSDSYVTTATHGWRPLLVPIPTELRIALVYRPGRYPTVKKYRWRMDVDADYAARLLQNYTDREQQARDRQLTEDALQRIRADFEEIYQHFLHESEE